MKIHLTEIREGERHPIVLCGNFQYGDRKLKLNERTKKSIQGDLEACEVCAEMARETFPS